MNLEETLKELGVDFRRPGEHEHTTGNFINIDCPYCSPGSQHFRLGVHIKYFYATCWSCGRKDFAAALHQSCPGQSLGQIIKYISALKGTERIISPREEGRLKIPQGIEPLQTQHKKYLKERGFDWRELVKLWDIRGIGLSNEYSWRLFIPVYSNGRMVSWTTRSIVSDALPRYVSAPAHRESMSLKTLIYGADYVRHTAILTEGPISTWAVGPGACCTFGVAFTRAQIEWLSRCPIRIICFDSDRDGQRRAAEACRLLEVFDGETINVRLSQKDPAESLLKCPDELKELRNRFLGG